MSKIADRVLERLRGDDAPLRQQGVALAVEAALARPLNAYLDPDDAVALLVAGTTGENAARWVDRHAWPGFERNLERYEGEATTPADLIGPDARAQLERIVASARPPKSAWSRNAIDPKLVRELLAPVWQETLLGFARKLPFAGGGDGAAAGSGGSGRGFGTGLGLRNRLKERVESRAQDFVERSKSVLGGLGAEVERQVQAAAREFSQSATQTVRDALKERLRSDDGKRLVAEMRTQALAAVLDTPVAELQADSREMPVRDVMNLLPLIAEHSRTRDAYRAVLAEEVRAVLAVDGDRPVRDLLDEAGLLDRSMAQLLERADGIAAATVETDAFAAWIQELVKP